MGLFQPFSFNSSFSGSAYDDVWALWDGDSAGAGSVTWDAISGSASPLPTVTRTGANVTYVSSGSASHYTFAGGDYMTGSIAAFGPSGGGWTFNMWVMPERFSSSPVGQALYWIDTTGGASNADFGARTGNNRFYWEYYSAGSDASAGSANSDTTYSSPNTNWYMNTVVWNGVEASCYVNGTFKNSFTTTFSPYAQFTTPTLRVGYLDKQTTTLYLNGGKVAMMELWNRNLSSTEVTELWDTNRTRFGY